MPNFGSITETGLTWKNSKTGFRVVIDDDIDLLTSAEERKLLEEMIPLTEYGSVALWSTRGEDADVQAQAEEKRRSLCNLYVLTRFKGIDGENIDTVTVL